MMAASSEPKEENGATAKSNSNTGLAPAGVGGGVGTVIAGVGELLGSNTIAGQVLLLGAPAMSVAGAAGYAYLLAQIAAWNRNRKVEKFRALVKELKKDLDLPQGLAPKLDEARRRVELETIRKLAEGLGVEIRVEDDVED